MDVLLKMAGGRKARPYGTHRNSTETVGAGFIPARLFILRCDRQVMDILLKITIQTVDGSCNQLIPQGSCPLAPSRAVIWTHLTPPRRRGAQPTDFNRSRETGHHINIVEIKRVVRVAQTTCRLGAAGARGLTAYWRTWKNLLSLRDPDNKLSGPPPTLTLPYNSSFSSTLQTAG